VRSVALAFALAACDCDADAGVDEAAEVGFDDLRRPKRLELELFLDTLLLTKLLPPLAPLLGPCSFAESEPAPASTSAPALAGSSCPAERDRVEEFAWYGGLMLIPGTSAMGWVCLNLHLTWNSPLMRGTFLSSWMVRRT